MQKKGGVALDLVCMRYIQAQCNSYALCSKLFGCSVMAESINIGHEALVFCHEQLVSEIAGDPQQMAGVLFQHGFISKTTKDKVNELNETKEYKARLLVDDIESKIKSFPLLFEQFLAILKETEARYTDLIKALEEKYKRITQYGM